MSNKILVFGGTGSIGKALSKKLKKDKIVLNKDFYVFTGSTVGVVPIISKGLYTGKIDKLGTVKTIIK